ncbi:hypothetical protein [Salininema proteolyticum]|uniref:Secreted protein n=1 Tax=Salininema proteolyticum TaxID=1607685 RepID=A0ABV8TUZ7_9ACTN
MSQTRKRAYRVATGIAAAALGSAFIAAPAGAQLPIDDPVGDLPIEDPTAGETPDLQELLCSVISLDVVLGNPVLTDAAGNETPLQDLTGQLNAVPSVDDPTGELPVSERPGHQLDDVTGQLPVDLDIGEILLGSDPLAGPDVEGAPAQLTLTPAEGAEEQAGALPFDLTLLMAEATQKAEDPAEQAEDPTAALTELTSSIELDVQIIIEAILAGDAELALGTLLGDVELLDADGNAAGTLTTAADVSADAGGDLN